MVLYEQLVYNNRKEMPLIKAIVLHCSYSSMEQVKPFTVSVEGVTHCTVIRLGFRIGTAIATDEIGSFSMPP